MTSSKKIVWLAPGFLLAVLFVFLYNGVDTRVSAHPGNTAADGGHYCWTNCDYWGVPYGERHFHGGGYYDTGPSMSEQDHEKGTEHASDVNRNYIEENARSEASTEGYEDGMNESLYENPDPNSQDICTKEVEFETTPNYEYAVAFQESFEEECAIIYDDAYEETYSERYAEGIGAREISANTSDEDTNPDSSNGNGSGWLWFFGIIGGIWLLNLIFSKS